MMTFYCEDDFGPLPEMRYKSISEALKRIAMKAERQGRTFKMTTKGYRKTWTIQKNGQITRRTD